MDYKNIYVTSLIILMIGIVQCLRKYTKDDINALREEVKEMFSHAYDSYLLHAYPYDELRPLSCDGIDTWGSYSLTLIDALDTLAIMGNYSEFKRVVDIITKKENFDANINVSVFETNIRIIGGLLSAHLMSHRAGLDLEPGWPCNGPLLRLAEDVAQRLIVAFDTVTGMPYGTVNLRSGVPRGETSITCTAGIGTFIVEFGTLSRLTGDPLYEEVAMHALKALYNHRSLIGLVGNHIDVLTGRWTAQDAGIGGGVDSYYEYLVKGSILLQKPELRHMFNQGRKVIDKYLKKDDWYVWASMSKGQVTLPVFQSLEAYWPGVLTLIGETETAMRIIHNYHSVWKQYGFTPEVYNIAVGEVSPGRESYPLRPELVESLMYLYRETRDPILLQMGEDILRSIQHSAKTNCGYATIKDVRDHRKEDRMESFFLAETTKYLYLLFDPDNFIHNPGTHGTVIDTPLGECVVDVGGYIFNTEAHPIDPAMLECCYNAGRGLDLDEVDRMSKVLQEEDKLKLRNINMTTTYTIDFLDDEPDVSGSHEGKSAEELLKEVVVLGLNDIIKLAKEKRERYHKGTAESIPMTQEENHNMPNLGQESNVLVEQKTDNQNVNLKKGSSLDSTKGDPKDDGKFDDQNNARGSVGKVEPLSEIGAENASNKKSDNSINNLTISIPDFVQDFITNSIPAKAKCEPQFMLERIRNDKLYEKFSMTKAYHLLLSPPPTFLQRISLAGEFTIMQK